MGALSPSPPPVYRLFFDFGHEALEPLRQPLPPKDGDSKQQAKREQILKLRAEYEPVWTRWPS